MAVKFDFLSPGVNIREIDQSILPAQAQEPGPVLIGRARKGPAMQPVLIRTYEDFVDVFGAPTLGSAGINNDAWRNGNLAGPHYAGLAAQAHLASQTSPVTFVRLLGDDNPTTPITGDAILPGWSLSGSLSADDAANSTAYGLFLVDSGSATANPTGALAAVFYVDSGFMTLSGAVAGDPSTITSSAGCLVASQGSSREFKAVIYSNAGSKLEEISFNFDDSDNSKYVRSQFNTNPIMTNSELISQGSKTYWLGETFDRFAEDTLVSGSNPGDTYGILLPLQDNSSNNWADHNEGFAEAQSGWVISQDQGAAADYDPTNSTQIENLKLFRLISLHGGDSLQKEVMVGISGITLPVDSSVDAFATFNIEVMDLAGNILEEFRNVNLNPQSADYIVARMGDRRNSWSESERRYNVIGDEPNLSNYFRVEVASKVSSGAAQGLAPFGFLGPVRPKGFSLAYGSQGAQTFGDGINNGTPSNAEITITAGDIDNGATITLTSSFGFEYTIDFDSSVALAASSASFDANNLAKIGIDSLTAAQSASVGAQILTILQAAPTNGNGFIQSQATYDGADGSGYIVGVSASLNGPAVFTMSEAGDSSGDIALGSVNAGTDTDDFAGAFVRGNVSMPYASGDASTFATLPINYTASFRFPKMALRGAGSEGNPVDQFEVYYGIRPMTAATTTRVDTGFVDYTRRLPAGIDGYTPGSDYEYSFVFSLDDLIVNESQRTASYSAGSRALGDSRTATSGAANLLDLDIQQFVMPIWGGFDGLDVTEKEPFRNKGILDSATYTSQTNNAPLYSVFKAVDSIRDNEQIIANTISMPGATADRVTDKLISIAETRKDLLAVIDLEGGYEPSTEDSSASIGSVTSVISNTKARRFNTSYACTFYPWVQLNANTGVESGKLWAPPSVAAIGAFAKSTAESELWFAPAGFSRGGLSPLGGVGGPSVVNVDGTLSAKQRDKLYQININPIASFPGEGIVVFGQKTLQATPSALDRINVRRLLIYLKHELSRISRGLLFEPNVNATWLSFKTQADTLLSQVKANFGVTEYKVVLDETTTTADLIDRNILYAKVYIKPTRAIEYIVVDLVVTNTGAEFV